MLNKELLLCNTTPQKLKIILTNATDLDVYLETALIGKKGALNGAPGGLRLEKIDQPLQTGS